MTTNLWLLVLKSNCNYYLHICAYLKYTRKIYPELQGCIRNSNIYIGAARKDPTWTVPPLAGMLLLLILNNSCILAIE